MKQDVRSDCQYEWQKLFDYQAVDMKKAKLSISGWQFRFAFLDHKISFCFSSSVNNAVIVIS